MTEVKAVVYDQGSVWLVCCFIFFVVVRGSVEFVIRSLNSPSREMGLIVVAVAREDVRA